MSDEEFHRIATENFAARYDLVREFRFVQDRPERLADHSDEVDRRCRFCKRGRPEVSFKEVAHAAPEFLGNRAIVSMNECDGCNAFFGKEVDGKGGYEAHLANWSLLARSLAGVPRKKSGRPTFKSADLRVGSNATGLQLNVPSPATGVEALAAWQPGEWELPGDTTSPPYIPIRAAKALVKVACSLCPTALLPECAGAIDWLMGRKTIRLAPFPVLYAFTAGVIGDELNGVTLLRRKGEGHEPFLWCVVRFRNFQLQTFVPFCQSDGNWLKEDEPCALKLAYYPAPFGPEAGTQYGQGDWSGEVETTETVRVVIYRTELIGFTPPPAGGRPPLLTATPPPGA
ncbi:MAG: HNH endonuclease [Gemmataceae bacterium]